MGINKVLENTLDSLCEEYNLRYWSIFHEKNGCISLRIKFDVGHDAVKRDNVAFRRKSPSQVARDKRRSEQWRENRHPVPSRQSPSHADMVAAPVISPPGDGVITRSRSKTVAEVEILRCGSPEADDKVSLSFTPSQLNPLASPFSTPQRDMIPDVPPSETAVCSQADPPPHDTPSPEYTAESLDDDVESDSLSDVSWTTDPGVVCRLGGCDMYMCMYGGGSSSRQDYSTNDIYTCTRCDHTSVCHTCMDNGGHSRHRRYLVPEDSIR